MLVIDTILPVCGIVAETICAGCLLLKRTFKTLPLVTFYVAYNAITEMLGFAMFIYGSARAYSCTYLLLSYTGYIVDIAVIWELVAWSTTAGDKRRELSTLNKAAWSWLFLFALLSIATALLAGYPAAEPSFKVLLQWDLAFAVFRASAFIAILGLAQIRGLGLKNLEALVTACLALYAGFTLMAEIVHQFAARMHLHYVDYETIESVHTGTWCFVMLLLSWHILVNSYSGGGKRSDAHPEQSVSRTW